MERFSKEQLREKARAFSRVPFLGLMGAKEIAKNITVFGIRRTLFF